MSKRRKGNHGKAHRRERPARSSAESVSVEMITAANVDQVMARMLGTGDGMKLGPDADGMTLELPHEDFDRLTAEQHAEVERLFRGSGGVMAVADYLRAEGYHGMTVRGLMFG